MDRCEQCDGWLEPDACTCVIRESRDRAAKYAAAQRASKLYWFQRALWAEHHLSEALRIGLSEAEEARAESRMWKQCARGDVTSRLAHAAKVVIDAWDEDHGFNGALEVLRQRLREWRG